VIEPDQALEENDVLINMRDDSVRCEFVRWHSVDQWLWVRCITTPPHAGMKYLTKREAWRVPK
jgi:hypothetical protein